MHDRPKAILIPKQKPTHRGESVPPSLRFTMRSRGSSREGTEPSGTSPSIGSQAVPGRSPGLRIVLLSAPSHLTGSGFSRISSPFTVAGQQWTRPHQRAGLHHFPCCAFGTRSEHFNSGSRFCEKIPPMSNVDFVSPECLSPHRRLTPRVSRSRMSILSCPSRMDRLKRNRETRYRYSTGAQHTTSAAGIASRHDRHTSR